MMKKIAAIPLLYEPGTKWSYSVAVDIQGYLVQKLSGQKFGDYLKAHVTGPIGMTDTAFYVSPDPQGALHRGVSLGREQNRAGDEPVAAPDRGGFEDPARLESGGGGLVGSTHDYARFCQMLLNKGEIGGKRHPQAETVKLMTRTTSAAARRRRRHRPQPGAAAGALRPRLRVSRRSRSRRPAVRHGTFYWGGAAGTWFWVDPVNDLAFIGMIQMQGGYRPDVHELPRGLGEAGLRGARGVGDEVLPAAPPPQSPTSWVKVVSW
jgi:CubicO group peptidase (beta-lactamase class C family)